MRPLRTSLAVTAVATEIITISSFPASSSTIEGEEAKKVPIKNQDQSTFILDISLHFFYNLCVAMSAIVLPSCHSNRGISLHYCYI